MHRAVVPGRLCVEQKQAANGNPEIQLPSCKQSSRYSIFPSTTIRLRAVSTEIPAIIRKRSLLTVMHFGMRYREAPIPVLLCVAAAASMER